MAVLRLDGDASGAERAIADTAAALDRLEAKARATQVAPDARGVKSLEGDIRALEAAGRVLGGRFGELTGALGDFSDIAESGAGKLGLYGAAVGAVAVGYAALAAGAVKATQAAIDVARETGRMTDELLDAERAFAAVGMASDDAVLALGQQLAPVVTQVTYGLVGLISAVGEAAGAIADFAASPAGKFALYLSGLDIPLQVASAGLDMFAERGRRVMQAMEDARIASQDLFKPFEAAQVDRQRGGGGGVGAQTAENRAPYDAAVELERIRIETIRGLRQAEFDELQAFADAASEIEFQSLAETMAAEEEANAARVEAARRAADLVAQQWEQSYAIQRESAFTAVNAAIGLLSDLVGENREAAIAMFAIRQAAAIAESIVNTQVAATRAVAELGPIAGPPAAVAIQAAGAVSAGVIAAQAVAEGISTFGPGAQGAGSNTYNLVVEGRAVRGAVRPFGTSPRRPAGQR